MDLDPVVLYYDIYGYESQKLQPTHGELSTTVKMDKWCTVLMLCMHFQIYYINVYVLIMSPCVVIPHVQSTLLCLQTYPSNPTADNTQP